MAALDPDHEFGLGVSDAQITELERQLTVVVPPDYRQFLATFGCFQIRGAAYFGIDLSEGQYADTARRTLFMRANLDLWRTRVTRRHQQEMIAFYESWPLDALILKEDWNSNPIVLYSPSSTRRGQVAHIVQQVRGEGYLWKPIAWWPTFSHWLQSELDSTRAFLQGERSRHGDSQ
jgi:hypothetical protein